jgi:tRNA threonylcarbamoyladenosine modification (KEOPS) complex  Pcc1 subunit
MKIKIALEYNCSNDEEANALYSALALEQEEGERARLTLKIDNKKICIVVEAEDATAARAFINSILRYLQVAESINLIKEKGWKYESGN